jgi:membrane associated rhomboid family serine protease
MNIPPRFWFRLQRLKSAWHDFFHSPERSSAAGLRMCPECRGLIDRGESVCPLCGATVRPPRARTEGGSERLLGVIPMPSTATSVLVAANIALYAITWYMTQTEASRNLVNPPGWGGIYADVLVRMGAKCPLIFAGEWWRLVTAMFLHGGLIHIGFNMWVLIDLGPEAESLFTMPKYLFLYLVTGVAGYVLSLWWNPGGISIGASGALMGLIGILIGASFHHGSLGKEYRQQLWKWVIYIFILALLPGLNIDNAAHLGGLASGLVLGYVIPEGEPQTRASQKLWNALAVLSVLVIAGSFALMALGINRPL